MKGPRSLDQPVELHQIPWAVDIHMAWGQWKVSRGISATRLVGMTNGVCV